MSGNTVYRGTSSNADQRTSIQRGLDRTAGDEEYVLVPDGNIVSLATQQFRQIYLLLLKPIFGTTKQSCFSGSGDVSGPPGDSYDLQDRDSSR